MESPPAGKPCEGKRALRLISYFLGDADRISIGSSGRCFTDSGERSGLRRRSLLTLRSLPFLTDQFPVLYHLLGRSSSRLTNVYPNKAPPPWQGFAATVRSEYTNPSFVFTELFARVHLVQARSARPTPARATHHPDLSPRRSTAHLLMR